MSSFTKSTTLAELITEWMKASPLKEGTRASYCRHMQFMDEHKIFPLHHSNGKPVTLADLTPEYHKRAIEYARINTKGSASHASMNIACMGTFMKYIDWVNRTYPQPEEPKHKPIEMVFSYPVDIPKEMLTRIQQECSNTALNQHAVIGIALYEYFSRK